MIRWLSKSADSVKDIALRDWRAAVRINNISDRDMRIHVARTVLYRKRTHVELGWFVRDTAAIRGDIRLLVDYIKEMETT